MWTSYQVLSGLIPVRKKITKILHSVLSCISPAQRKFINIVRRIKAEVWIPIYKNETSLYIYGLKPSYHRFMRSEEWSSSHTASNQSNICLLLISAFSLLRGNLGILLKGENGNNIIIYAFNVFFLNQDSWLRKKESNGNMKVFFTVSKNVRSKSKVLAYFHNYAVKKRYIDFWLIQ